MVNKVISCEFVISDNQPAPAPGHTLSCVTPQYHDGTLNYNNHTGNNSAGLFPDAEPTINTTAPAPELSEAKTDADFYDALVSQAATATEAGAVHHDYDHWDNDDIRPDSGMSGAQEADDDEYLDQQTCLSLKTERAARVSVFWKILMN